MDDYELNGHQLFVGSHYISLCSIYFKGNKIISSWFCVYKNHTFPGDLDDKDPRGSLTIYNFSRLRRRDGCNYRCKCHRDWLLIQKLLQPNSATAFNLSSSHSRLHQSLHGALHLKVVFYIRVGRWGVVLPSTVFWSDLLKGLVLCGKIFLLLTSIQSHNNTRTKVIIFSAIYLTLHAVLLCENANIALFSCYNIAWFSLYCRAQPESNKKII